MNKKSKVTGIFSAKYCPKTLLSHGCVPNVRCLRLQKIIRGSLLPNLVNRRMQYLLTNCHLPADECHDQGQTYEVNFDCRQSLI